MNKTPRVDKQPAEVAASPSSVRPARSVSLMPKTRFGVALLVLISMGVAVLLTQLLTQAEHGAIRGLGVLIALFMGFFGCEWSKIHANALTRHKHAHFDEVNILETYQPRARTHGHLFQPDPPTPGLTVNFSDADKPNKNEPERILFNANRDAHYAGMFNYAIRVAQEQGAMEGGSLAPAPEPSRAVPDVKETKPKNADDSKSDKHL